jgi:hypothetical protein
MLDDSAPSATENTDEPILGPDQTPVAPPPSASLADREVSRPVLLAAIVPLLGFVLWQGPNLWHEWKDLQADRAAIRASALIGYIGISPAAQYAQPPRDWMHEEGNDLVLWSGWNGAAGHSWFRAGTDDFDRSSLNGPAGRDVHRAIDRPIVEINGGVRWERLQDEAHVVGLQLGDTYTIYPVMLLQNVLIVNDRVGDDVVVVVFTPAVDASRAVNAYGSVVGSTRLTFGTSGYSYQRRPLLYDRATESLWLSDDAALTALSGPYKGTVLPRIASLPVQPWSSACSDHPQTRLVVGADRSVKLKPLP